MLKICLLLLKVASLLKTKKTRFDLVILGGNLKFPAEVLKEALNYYEEG